MSNGNKVVLVSHSGYSEEHNALLQELIENKIELFCAVGVDCEDWEDAMDCICVELDANGIIPGAFCTTTSHPNESVDDAIQFAENWSQGANELKIIEI